VRRYKKVNRQARKTKGFQKNAISENLLGILINGA